MKNDLLHQAAKYNKIHQHKKRWYRVVTCLAAIVVFCTTYALILPAITLEKSPTCGKTEHVHGEECYVYETVLDTTESVDNIQESMTESVEQDAVTEESNVDTEESGENLEELGENTGEANVDVNESGMKPEESEAKPVLICGLEEHIHDEELCYIDDSTSSEVSEETENALVEKEDRVSKVNAAIEELPFYEEIEEKLAAYEEADDMDAYTKYYETVSGQALSTYILYEDLNEDERAKVTNLDKLLDLEWMWSSRTLELKQGIDVYQVNSYNNSGDTVIFFGNSADGYGYTGMDFSYWSAIIVEENSDGVLYVSECITAEGVDKSAYVSQTEKGFVLLIWHGTASVDALNIEVGNLVSVSFDYTQTSAYTGSSYGTITFADGVFKEDKDNSDKLEIVPGADTGKLIEVNLYDYKDNINELWRTDSKYPGFQQDNGTTSVGSSFTTYGFNFGNNITADLSAGESSITNKGGSINATMGSYDGVDYGNANIPISDAMYATLLDGYPALSDGTSLSYLFIDSEYADKQNQISINGLFQKNELTGAYSFNSRENHAQFNPENDTFTLYRQIISSNFMMYPFGNFLPFNDIVKLCAQTSLIDREYMLSIASGAQYKANTGMGEEYASLAESLQAFIGLLDVKYGMEWTAADAMNEYFSAAKLNASFNQEDSLLQNLYSIDFDEPTNFFFGMEMKMNFMQPKNGLTGNDGQQPMVFYFTGDDDVWVYIDDRLFLDLSGIHRHVGGEIDFVNGIVNYYALDVSTGDVSTVPYKTVTFAEILGNTNSLNEQGTFKNYSYHSFNFYYLERGAGSGVCRMNFNFPLLKQNSVSVAKELTVDEQDKLVLLGNPDFKFQVLKADSSGNKTEELFIGAGASYTIYDDQNNEIGTGTTDTNGVFTLKAGQRAEFTNIQENAGKYYVRELVDPAVFEQYGSITVDGSSTTTSNNITVGSDTFTGVSSPVKDASDGTTIFHFNNQVTFNKLGSLEIQKILNAYPNVRTTPEFEFYVTLDGVPVPVGTAYIVKDASNVSSTREVTTAGSIVVPAGSTAMLSDIIAGTRFVVQETTASSAGYTVTYAGSDGVTTDGTSAFGKIQVDSGVAVMVTNSENGTNLNIPVKKNVLYPDGTERTFRFKVEQVTDASGMMLVQDGVVQNVEIAVTNTAEQVFTLAYLEKDISTYPATYYYKVTETVPEGAENSNSMNNSMNNSVTVDYDESIYVMEVTVTKDTAIAAAVTKLWKNGTLIMDTTEGDPADSTVTVGAEFTNVLLADLTLEKVLAGISSDMEFTFEVMLEQNGTRINGTFRGMKSSNACVSDGDTPIDITFVDGKATVSLKAGESMTMCNLPYGAAWTVTEINAEGFHTNWQVNGTAIVPQGNTANGTMIGNTSIICINAATYVLPNTGGTGTNLYTMGGLLTLTAAGYLLLCKYKKRGKEDSASS